VVGVYKKGVKKEIIIFKKIIALLVMVILLAGCGDPDCTDGVAADCKAVVERNPTTVLTCTLNPGTPGCEK
jgi:uncharacterized lipoprotein YajG